MDGARRPLCMLRGISSCHPPRPQPSGLRHFRTAGWGALDYDETGFMLQPRYKDVRRSVTRFYDAFNNSVCNCVRWTRWSFKLSLTPPGTAIHRIISSPWSIREPSSLQEEFEGARFCRPKRIALKCVNGYLTNVNKYVSVSRYIFKRHVYDEETDFYVTFISQSRLQSVTGFYDVERFGSTYTRQFKLPCYAARCTAK